MKQEVKKRANSFEQEEVKRASSFGDMKQEVKKRANSFGQQDLQQKAIKAESPMPITDKI